MARRRRSKNPTGWSPLVIGLAGVGVYLAYRKWSGLGNGDYGRKPTAGATTPKPPPVVLPYSPAPAPTFWQKALAVATPLAPSSAGYSASAAAFQAATAAAAPALARTTVTPQYKVMEQVDFSIDEKPKSQMEKLQEYGKQPWMIEKERQAERRTSESAKAQEAKELLGPPMKLEIPRPLPLSDDQKLDEFKKITKQGQEMIEKTREVRRQVEAAGGEAAARSIAERKWIADSANKAITELSQKIGTEEKYLAAADSDLKVLQAEMSFESDPAERAKLAQSVKEMRDLNLSEMERVTKKVDLMTEHLVAAAYTEVSADMAADAEVKIRQVRARFGKAGARAPRPDLSKLTGAELLAHSKEAARRVGVPQGLTAEQMMWGAIPKGGQREPSIPAQFTPTQRAMSTVSMDDEFGM